MRGYALIVGVVVACAAVSASADPLGTAKLTNSVGIYSYNDGGEFNADIVVSGTVQLGTQASWVKAYGGSMQVFCLEYNEHFSPGATYYADISTEAKFNGNGTVDPLDASTAYLYDAFSRGVLSGYYYDAAHYAAVPGDPVLTRSASAGALQAAIWVLEDERTLDQAKAWLGGVLNNSAGIQKMEQWIAEAQLAAGPNGVWGNTLGNVRVMNLWTSAARTPGSAAQDQLVWIEPPPSSGPVPAPLPGTAAAAAALFGVLSVARRRRIR